MNLKPYIQPKNPVWWISAAVGCAVFGSVLLAMFPPAGMVEAFEADSGNTICNGMYCGGSVWKSPLGVVFMVAVPIGLVGLVMAAIKAMKPSEAKVRCQDCGEEFLVADGRDAFDAGLAHGWKGCPSKKQGGGPRG